MSKSKYAIRYNIDEEKARDLFLNQNLGMQKTADALGVSEEALRRFFRNKGISKQRFSKGGTEITLRQGERICPICGEVYCKYADPWAYERIDGNKKIYPCSYTCMRKYDATHKKYDRRRKREKSVR